MQYNKEFLSDHDHKLLVEIVNALSCSMVKDSFLFIEITNVSTSLSTEITNFLYIESDGDRPSHGIDLIWPLHVRLQFVCLFISPPPPYTQTCGIPFEAPLIVYHENINI